MCIYPMNLIMTPTMEGKVTDNNFYTYDIKDIHMIKAVASKLSKIGLTQNKELAICLAIDYMASTNIASSFDYSTKFSRIANPMWATGSEHEDKKSNNQYSECNDKEETYAHYNETL